MATPSLTQAHLKTSKQYQRTNLIHRYWFEWQNRRTLKAILLRIELLGPDGTVLTTSSVQLPKVKITGYLPATDTSPQKPVYDSTVWIQLGDIIRDTLPTSLRYYTLSGLTMSKSDSVTVPMNGTYDDISHYG